MNRALWLLLWLRLRGWARRIRRNLGTVKGALIAAVGLLVTACWLIPSIVWTLRGGQRDPEAVVRFGPLMLLAYCLVNVAFSSGERAITFSPPEINFLFPGPFSRRQLLGYKVAAGVGGSLFGGLIFAIFVGRYAPSWPAAYAALVLALVFMNLFAMVLALVANTIGALAFSRGRKLLLVALAAAVLMVLVTQGQRVLELEPAELLRRVEQSPAVQTALEPLRWFAEAFTAERLWPDFVRSAALALAVDLVLLLVVWVLDARYLEASAASSEKLYARLERLRRGGPAAAGFRKTKVRVSLPSLPWWGGVGPIAWRQAVAALRSVRAIVMPLVILALVFVPMVLGARQRDEGGALGGLLAALVFWALFGTQFLTFDFRGDVDRIDFLKTLPIRASRIVLGELATPVLLASLIHVIALVGVLAALGRPEPILLAALVFVLPVNALLFEIENLLFLWYPSRTAQAAPGDFHAMGRQSLVMLAKFVIIALAGGLAALLGFAVYHIPGGGWPAALAAAWALWSAVVVALVPLIAVALETFDVARETPPQ